MNQIFFELFYEGINTEAQQIVREVTMQVLTSFASVYAFTLDAQLHVTTYRCAIVLRGLPSEFTYQPINVKGPKITASNFVLEKFSQQGGVLLQKDGYYYLEKECIVIDLQTAAKQLLKDILSAIPWKNNVLTYGWYRPLRNIILMVNDTHVSKAHELISDKVYILPYTNQCYQLKNYTDYEQFLLQHNIILCFEARMKKALEFFEKANKNIDPKDVNLLYCVNLLESVYIYFVDCDVDLPQKITSTIMVDHLKFIPIIEKGNTHITSYAICIREALQDASIFLLQSQRALQARYDDAKFFLKEDFALPLHKYNELLQNYFIYDKASYAEQKDRLRKYTSEYSELIDYLNIDLASKSVYELTSLQHHITYLYAQHHRVNPKVVNNLRYIAEQTYDKSIAEFVFIWQLDTLCTCASEISQQSQKDPLGLRRIGNTIAYLLRNFDVSIHKWLHIILEKLNGLQYYTKIYTFIKKRIEYMLLQEGIEQEIITFILQYDDSLRCIGIQKFCKYNNVKLFHNVMQRLSNLMLQTEADYSSVDKEAAELRDFVICTNINFNDYVNIARKIDTFLNTVNLKNSPIKSKLQQLLYDLNAKYIQFVCTE